MCEVGLARSGLEAGRARALGASEVDQVQLALALHRAAIRGDARRGDRECEDAVRAARGLIHARLTHLPALLREPNQVQHVIRREHLVRRQVVHVHTPAVAFLFGWLLSDHELGAIRLRRLGRAALGARGVRPWRRDWLWVLIDEQVGELLVVDLEVLRVDRVR